ncbi:Lanosterol 14-alpha-demethylase [Borealophlyctis nickersoniae]|nr:Lanosterol 14-alpha-demethylase [Borealophlyctis nickersoniae]
MGLFVSLASQLVDLTGLAPEKLALYGALLLVAVLFLIFQSQSSSKVNGKLAPSIPGIPILGSAIEYGIDPVKFLQKCQEKYGDVFTFTMLGRKMTFCLAPEGNHFVFNVKLAHATAEGAYDKLTVPVFGEGVVYDVDNSIFMEQKKFVKDALTTTAFRSYIPILLQETRDFLKTWKDQDNKFELFPAMAELTIRTASHCLMGKEIRKQLHTDVAQLYHDLDRGLQPINVFIRWLPTPTYYKRDKANRIMTDLFLRILKDRRAQGDMKNNDVLQSLMDSTYRDGSKMSDEAIAHMMIAALMAGQHTSSTTVSWIIFQLANNPEWISALLKEQSEVLTGKPDTPASELPDFDYDQLRKMPLIECVMKETLRLHPPIHTVMRLVVKDLEYKGYTIPAGHFLCGSQAVSQVDPVRYPDPLKFDPMRHMGSEEGSGEWTINGVDIAQKSAKSHFLPFGAGRHRCIGEAFAYVQIKTIISVFIREFEHSLPLDANGKKMFPKMDYTSLIVMPQKPADITYKRREKA